jgi:hypothetical protein
MVTSAGGEASLRRGKVGDNASGTGTNLTGPKNKKIYVVDSAATNGQWRFKATMS